jgi:hypothetical protein
MVLLNADVVAIILDHLWVSHSTSWDTEFRAEAFRHYFIQYALISRLWTLPAEIFIYRSAHLTWHCDWLSLQCGFNNPQRGQSLRGCVRVLDLSISHSQLSVPLILFDKILQGCPNLVELRLRIGPQVNTLFVKPSQEKKLRQAFQNVRPTLRALQMSIDQERTKSKVAKQISEMVVFENLDLLTFQWIGDDFGIPEMDGDLWDTQEIGCSSIHWPLETNASIIWPNRTLSSTSRRLNKRLVVPIGLRIYHWGDSEIGQLLTIIGPHLCELLLPESFRSVTWTGGCIFAIGKCPNLQRLLILSLYITGGGCLPYEARANFELYILEPSDWQKAILPEQHTSIIPSYWMGGMRLPNEELVETASHVVIFNNTWQSTYGRPVYRKPVVYDARYPIEAFIGSEEKRTPREIAAYDEIGAYMDARKLRSLHLKVATRRGPVARREE